MNTGQQMIIRNHGGKPAGPIFQCALVAIVLAVIIGAAAAGVFGPSVRLGFRAFFNAHPTCRFDRNEPGPQGWWWEFYKCSDGTERRQLVAGPRG